MEKLTDKQQQVIFKSVREIADFPKEGVMFKDITTLCNNPEAFQLICQHMAAYYKSHQVDFVVGIESRGFIMGAVIAYLLGVGFVPIRKKGKLPGKVIKEEYDLEYGSDVIEIHEDAFAAKENPNVLLLDDVLVTGGTAKAAINLIRRAGGRCDHATFAVSIKALGGHDRLSDEVTVYSVLEEE